jgi:hypothetical protein
MLLAFQYSFAFAAPLPTPLLLFATIASFAPRRSVGLLYNREDAERILRQKSIFNVNGGRSTHAQCKRKPFSKVPGGRFELPTKGL